MSSWSYQPNRVVVRRPEPNSAITWVLALVAPLELGVAAWTLLAAEPPFWLLLGLVGAAVNWALASLDARRMQALPDRSRTEPALAAPTPLLYLLVRMVRDPDPRAGRPFWSAVGLMPVMLFILCVAALGAYAGFVHGS